ncbi:PTS sugar transporter subunit IIB [Lactobacillus sp. ESL0259]|uniref:PTS system mannose/fructose/N-acetylgalactosamine-transporter subunit IIB n=1 Tax=Lactobacillus sp. ESL0259 TaxID=2069346 RepID=UPI000EFCDD86|nr:PTS sugar transporter subunit IIB [Lactobacillus sp. ESL0259]RMC61465.1 PTS mannose/fructose/sorbose transporter subunit IIB [Lactobacillus sp. ESL0259]
MIQLIRIDDRLLHGQVAYSWKGSLGYEAIVIASDNAANDEIRKSAMKMAKPDGVHLAIRKVKDAVDLLNNPRLKSLKVFVVTDTVDNADYILRHINEKPVLNIGGLAKREDKIEITQYAYITSEEKEVLKKLNSDGFKVEFRLVPSDTPKKLNDLIKGGE